MHTVRWFQVLQTLVILFNINGFKSSKWLNCFIWHIDGILTGTTTLGQRRPRSNDNEGVLHIPKSSRTGISLSDGLMSYPGHLLGGERSYHSAHMQSECSAAPVDWVLRGGIEFENVS